MIPDEIPDSEPQTIISEELLKSWRKNFAEIPLRQENTPPDILEVVTCVGESLLHLNPEVYSFELLELGHDRIFNIFERGQLFGKYSLGPGSPGQPTWNRSDQDPTRNLALWRERESIWLMIWTDLARRFGRWPWKHR